MKTTFIAIIFSLFSVFSFSQNHLNMGLGLGLHYGGAGINFSATPVNFIALDLGVGYNLVGFGVNGGLSIRFLPNRKVCPDLGFLYGYNAVLIVKNMSEWNKTYYGPSLTGGLKVFNDSHRNYFNFQLLIPFRSDKLQEDIDYHNLVLERKILPFAVSLGYHFAL